MSDSGKAVFLSYASQDKAAAQRIAEALRAAGVEVWFDQSELRGGDAWDALIRKRIKECALFVPIISTTTNARAEGYFRLEWKLAVDRSHLMADDAPFLFPIVLGDVADATARVPDKFRDVQWTRLRLDETPAELGARVAKILSGEQGAGSREQHEAGRGGRRMRGGQPPWLRYAWMGVGIVFALMFAIRPLFQSERRREPKPAVVAPSAPDAPLSAARGFVAQARPLIQGQATGGNPTRDDLLLAEDLCRQALKLDENDAVVWAAYAELSSQFFRGGIDRSPERMELARTQTERAMKLAPLSFEARYAKASYLRGFDGPALVEAEKLLRELAAERPDDAHVLISLGKVIWGALGAGRNLGRGDEALDVFARAAAIPGDARPEALLQRGWLLFNLERYAEAERAFDEALRLQPSSSGLRGLKAVLAAARGDLAAAKASLAQMPESQLHTDQNVGIAAPVWLLAREPDKCLALLAGVSRDYLSSNTFIGTVDGLRGDAYQLAGRTEAARNARQTALRVVERRLADQPRDESLLGEHAKLLAQLGEREAAAQALRLFGEIYPNPKVVGWSSHVWIAHVLLDPPERVIALLESAVQSVGLMGQLRLGFHFDPLRGHPRFEALLKKQEANAAEPKTGGDSSFATASAVAKAMADKSEDRSGLPATPDPKSVAVLPFNNVSGDATQEYFSDGLTDEILTALTNERDLRVVARTSAFAFKGKSMSLAEIARALNVAQVVEGSVRKSGNTVKITVSLTRAGDGFSEPLGTFTEKLDDIFALQEKVARAVVEKLTKRTATAGGVMVLTQNPEAYDLYLKVRAESRNPGPRRNESINLRERWLKAAVTLDPRFAAGWAELAMTHAEFYNNNADHSDERLALVKAAIDEAARLAPDLPELLSAQGRYYLLLTDYPRAAEQFEKRIRLQPSDANAYYELAVAQRRQGRWAEARANFEKTSQLDPGNSGALRSGIIRLLENGRRYEEAAQWQRRLVALQPDNVVEGYNLAKLAFKARGSTREVEDYLTGLKDTPQVLALRQNWMALQGNYAEAIRLGRQLNSGGTKPTAPAALQLALLLSATGDVPGARALLAGYPAELRTSLEREPANSTILRQQAFIEAVLGHRDEALRAARQGMELLPESLNPWDGASRRATLAFVLAWTGDRDGALAEYAKLLRMLAADSSEQNVREMRHHPLYFPLQGDRRFEALLNDPKNDEPLL